MHLLQHFHELSLHPKNAKELKGLILQLAMQGKLTKKWREENPELISGENSAEALLERIKDEKARLIQEKIIRQPKNLDPIDENDVLFDIPTQWSWARSGEFVEVIRGITFPKGAKSLDPTGDEIPCLRTTNVQEKVDWEDLIFVSEEYVKREDQYVMKRDILISLANSRELVGKVCIVEKELEDKFTFGGFIGVLRPVIFNQSMLVNYLRSPHAREVLIGSSSQTTNIANISVGKLNTLPIPIPPLPEQKAIVSIVEQLFTEVEQLEQLTEKRIKLKKDFAGSALSRLSIATETTAEWEYLQPHFPTFFNEESNIKKLRETILQLAVQGKLTSRWRQSHPLQHDEALSPPVGGDVAPERDKGGIEPASKLLERIKAEKARLVKEGKIRKEKPLPPVTEEELPYKLPEGWVWCRFQEVFDIRDGTHDSPKDSTGANTYPLITSKNFKDGQIDFESARRISKADYSKVIQRSAVHTGDILFSMIGGNIGNQVEVGEFTEYAIKNVALFKHYRTGLPAPGFLKLFSKHIAMSLQNQAAGGAQPFVSLKFFRNLVLGLPPLEEQKTIVATVNSLMALCDELEEQVREGKQQAEDLMQAVVRKVFEGEKEYLQEGGVKMAAEGREEYNS